MDEEVALSPAEDNFDLHTEFQSRSMDIEPPPQQKTTSDSDELPFTREEIREKKQMREQKRKGSVEEFISLERVDRNFIENTDDKRVHMVGVVDGESDVHHRVEDALND